MVASRANVDCLEALRKAINNSPNQILRNHENFLQQTALLNNRGRHRSGTQPVHAKSRWL